MNAEVTHLLMRWMIKLWGDRNTQVPEQLHVRRPGEKPPVMTMSQMARRMLGR